MMERKEMVRQAVKALEDKKGENIRVIDISGISIMADYFVIVTGKNTSQIQAMADGVEEILAKGGVHPRQIEGYNSAGWVLMDYGDMIIHIFNEDQRLFYDIERIWADGKMVEVTEI